ncbi:hypothetical protein SS50377_21714 [Spironucleus salmonicida]|uniref:Uncharacterized protein n=1 Tax=Spironucleus salmonicida TaxID=348837 RepID=V6LPJ6_9EUKA|nr:hypothetical protein SS50377_21714 [Spironucleus salmonicida]|eukprot:EST42649.1 Hypothetical protein SS50377_17751 [Spironucleus salmonicida]
MQSMNKPISLTTGHRNNKIQLMLALLLQESMQDKLMIKQGLLIFWYTVLQGECMYRLKADQWDSWDLNRSGVNTYYCILTQQQGKPAYSQQESRTYETSAQISKQKNTIPAKLLIPREYRRRDTSTGSGTVRSGWYGQPIYASGQPRRHD